MRLSKVLKSGIAVVLLVALIALTGCGKTIVLHLIEKQDIMSMSQGVAYTPEKDGWFVSDEYMEEVMQARVK